MTAPAVDIVPVSCFGNCHPAFALALSFAVIGVLVAGGLLMRRWRDLPFVAVVGTVAVIYAETTYTAWMFQVMPDLRDAYFVRPGFAHPAWWCETLSTLAVCLAIAATVHGIKRGVRFRHGSVPAQ